jgi:hypothetical protein
LQLSWNEIRARAADFSREWADAKYERGETQSFYNDFFEVFGIRRRRVTTFEAPVKKLGLSNPLCSGFLSEAVLSPCSLSRTASSRRVKAGEPADNLLRCPQVRFRSSS